MALTPPRTVSRRKPGERKGAYDNANPRPDRRDMDWAHIQSRISLRAGSVPRKHAARAMASSQLPGADSTRTSPTRAGERSWYSSKGLGSDTPVYANSYMS